MERNNFAEKSLFQEQRMVFVMKEVLTAIGLGKVLEGPIETGKAVVKAPFRLVRGVVRGGISDMLGKYPKKEGTSNSVPAKPERKTIKEKTPKPGGNILQRNLTKKGRAEKKIAKYEKKEEVYELEQEAKEAKQNWEKAHGSSIKLEVGEAVGNNWEAGKRIITQDTRNAVMKVSWPVRKPAELGWKAAAYVPKKVMSSSRKYKAEQNEKKGIRETAKAQIKQDAKVIEMNAYKEKYATKVTEAKEKASEKAQRKAVPFLSLKHKPFTTKKWRKAA